jgi:hypothetical protein
MRGALRESRESFPQIEGFTSLVFAGKWVSRGRKASLTSRPVTSSNFGAFAIAAFLDKLKTNTRQAQDSTAKPIHTTTLAYL